MEQTTKRRASIVRLGLELVEQSIVLVFLELKLGVMEIKRNVDSAKTGAVLLAVGGGLLLFSLLTLTATAVAALALVLPVWLSALIVTAALVFLGAALLFTGISKMKHFSLVPKETLDRVENISHKLKKHAEQRQKEEFEAQRAAQEEAAQLAAQAQRKSVRATREMTYSRERVKEAEERERKRA